MILTNGAGGIDPAFKAGEPVLISDHLNLTATSPVEGANFVDLTDLYASRLRELAREVEPSLQQGVYVQLPGPHYETPAEIRYLRTIGGQIVGMSTALEAWRCWASRSSRTPRRVWARIRSATRRCSPRARRPNPAWPICSPASSRGCRDPAALTFVRSRAEIQWYRLPPCPMSGY
jgi:hypothetical protein